MCDLSDEFKKTLEADKMCDMYDNVLHRCRLNHET